MLSTCTFNCLIVSVSDRLLQRGLTWNEEEKHVQPGDFSFFLALFSLCSWKNETKDVSDGGSDTETPGRHGTDPNNSLVNPTYVKSHMPTNISYTINVKM